MGTEPGDAVELATGFAQDGSAFVTIFDAPAVLPVAEDDPFAWVFTDAKDKDDGHSPDADQFVMTLTLD